MGGAATGALVLATARGPAARGRPRTPPGAPCLGATRNGGLARPPGGALRSGGLACWLARCRKRRGAAREAGAVRRLRSNGAPGAPRGGARPTDAPPPSCACMARDGRPARRCGALDGWRGTCRSLGGRVPRNSRFAVTREEAGNLPLRQVDEGAMRPRRRAEGGQRPPFARLGTDARSVTGPTLAQPRRERRDACTRHASADARRAARARAGGTRAGASSTGGPQLGGDPERGSSAPPRWGGSALRGPSAWKRGAGKGHEEVDGRLGCLAVVGRGGTRSRTWCLVGLARCRQVCCVQLRCCRRSTKRRLRLVLPSLGGTPMRSGGGGALALRLAAAAAGRPVA